MRKAIWLAGLLLPWMAQAADLSFSPQGATRDVRQATARFSEPMVRMGDPRLPPAFSVNCPTPGTGRWIDDRTFAYDFERAVPAGQTCRFHLTRDKTLAGKTLTGPRDFSFATGGPAIRATLPAEASDQVDAEQFFVLAVDAPAPRASIEAHAWCAVDNLAERLPLQVLEGQEREAILAQSRGLGYPYHRLLSDNEDEGPLKPSAVKQRETSLVVARCARPLPEETRFDLVWGAGIGAPGAVTALDQVLHFKTRPSFTASFTCERSRADAPCIPVLPLRLRFSSQVPAKLAAQVRLQGDGKTFKPDVDPNAEPLIDSIEFKPPFPESATLALQLPGNLRDDAGRALANAGSFPLKIATDTAPPLAKFGAPFGILEAREGGVLPVTLRDIESPVSATRLGGSRLRLDNEAQVIRWMAQVRREMEPRWGEEGLVQPGQKSVFDDVAPKLDTQSFEIKRPAGGKTLEVVGILLEPGFHVVEIASPRLGAALLGPGKTRYVATTALVTNLSVHFKWGRTGSLVFVTTLDGAKPVPDADLHIVDGCDGKPIWQGRADNNGIARIAEGLPKPSTWSSCENDNDEAHPLMISARSGGDFSFALSNWNEGITPSDFNLPMGFFEAHAVGHTVLDRSLFRAGETVSMKHYWREQTASGLAIPGARRDKIPDKLVIQHSGSDESVELPLSFDAAGIATSQWNIPREAKLGEYTLRMTGKDDLAADSGSFRVEQYRVPLMRAQIAAPKQPLIGATQAPLDLFVGYFSGGGAGGLPVKLRTQVQPRALSFKHYDEFTFGGDAVKQGVEENDDSSGYFLGSDDDAKPASRSTRTWPLTLDANGNASTVVDDLPKADAPQTLLTELEYADANGEITSVRNSTPLWPSAVVVGIASPGWNQSGGPIRFKTVVLDVQGKPLSGRAVTVAVYSVKSHGYRKRLVGGFYSYSNSSETRKLGASCSGRTDEHGLLACEIAAPGKGDLVLEATAADDKGRVSRAIGSAWISGDDDDYFAQNDTDRMDVIPQQREVAPGSMLKLQVRSPFRHATALVSVEREGVIDTFVTDISGRDPVIEVPMQARYAPNVYVSVLALRPRVSDFRAKLAHFLRWLHLDRWFDVEGDLPTAMVDLSRPAYRLGVASVDVGWSAHRLLVSVKPRQDSYATRGIAKVDVQVQAENGDKLPPQAEIAFSAVDEGLLDLLPNASVNLLQAMMQRRGIEVSTATAQTQVVGKRHYGRKAQPAGGGGGRGAARELLDSLLLWQARVPLDAQGRAQIEVPLNDALSAFRLTAIASAGADRFGEGNASIRTTQDIQLLSGLPPLVREGDRFDATFTVRNTTATPRVVTVDARITGDTAALGPAAPAPQSLKLPANSALPAPFTLSAPAGTRQLAWTVSVRGEDGKTLDALKVSQQVAPAVPLRVLQATLLQLDAARELPIAAPDDALRDGNDDKSVARGGLRIALASSLTASLGGVKTWMAEYPYSCNEQTASRAVALDDRAAWDALMARIGNSLDGDGLLKYFPSEALRGSDVLTAYVLQLADARGWEIPEAPRARMLGALERLVAGKLAPAGADDDRLIPQKAFTERRLAALEALARYDRAKVEWLSSLSFDDNQLRSSALIDWIGILQRLKDLPRRAERLAAAKQALRTRVNLQGTTMTLSSEDRAWWLMGSADVDATRALLALLPEGDWREDLPKLARGAIGRQQRGRWDLTTANAWGTLALRAFAKAFERVQVTGSTRAAIGDAHADHAWNDAAPATLDLPWPAQAATLALSHRGGGAPWATVQTLAAIPLRQPLSTGFSITRTVTPVTQKAAGRWTLGDVARIRLSVDAQSDMSWVVVDDPVPGGATIVGGDLGRGSELLAQGEAQSGGAWPAFEERRFDAWRGYYAQVPRGKFTVEYTVRYNSSGVFQLPPTHVEAMYAPEMLGELPNAAVTVLP